MGSWTHIIIEGYCLYKSLSVKKYKTVNFDDKSDIKIIDNSNYIPKTERPKWCVNKNKDFTPTFKCMCNGKKDTKCSFFAYTNADKKDYNLFNKTWGENN